jgi:hypothetical protein
MPIDTKDLERRIVTSLVASPGLLTTEEYSVLSRSNFSHSETADAFVTFKAAILDSQDILTLPASIPALRPYVDDTPKHRDQSLARADARELVQIRGEEALRTGIRDAVLSHDPAGLIRAAQQMGRAVKGSNKDAMMRIVNRSGTARTNCVTFGFPSIDEQLIDLEPGHLIVIGARPRMGKTAFLVNAMLNQARAGILSGIVSLEMSRDELLTRAIASEARMDSRVMRSGKATHEELHRIAGACASIGNLPFEIFDPPAATLGQLTSAVLGLVGIGCRCVFVDYLQLIQSDDRHTSSRERMDSVSKGMKALAKSAHVPIVAAAMANRASELRGAKSESKIPSISDLRESGQIEQDADVVAFIHRPEVYGDTDRKGEADFIIAKNRHGPTGSYPLRFDAVHTKFSEIPNTADVYNPPPNYTEPETRGFPWEGEP